MVTRTPEQRQMIDEIANKSVFFVGDINRWNINKIKRVYHIITNTKIGDYK